MENDSAIGLFESARRYYAVRTNKMNNEIISTKKATYTYYRITIVRSDEMKMLTVDRNNFLSFDERNLSS